MRRLCLLLAGFFLLAPPAASTAEAQLRPRYDAPYHQAYDTEFVSPAVHKWYGLRHLPRMQGPMHKRQFLCTFDG